MIVDSMVVFAYGVLVDISYVLWIHSTVTKSKIKAGAASVLIAAPAVFGVSAIVDNKWLSLPYFGGLFVGTILGIVISSRVISSPTPRPAAPEDQTDSQTGT